MADDSTASWWTNPGAQPDGVVRHAPADGDYHLPGADLLAKLPTSTSYAVIPKATNDGRSRGFNPSDPGVVCIDPGAPDGGAVVDFSTLTPALVQQQINRSQYPHEVFYGLQDVGVKQAAAPMPQMPVAPPRVGQRPGDYVVPPAALDGTQQGVQPMMPIPPLPRPVPMQAAPVYVGPEAYQAPAPMPVVPALDDQRLQRLEQTVNQLVSIVTAQVAPPPQAPLPPPRSLSTLPVEVRGQTPPPRPVRPDEDDDYEPVRQIPRLKRRPRQLAPPEHGLEDDEQLQNGAVPDLKPKNQVFFKIPGMGKIATRYHGIVDAKDCVVLIYDTRYEGAQQYVPEDMGESPFELHLPGETKKRYDVVSMGLEFEFEGRDFVVLLKKTTTPLPSTNEEA